MEDGLITTGTTTPGNDYDNLFEYGMKIHFNPHLPYNFPKALENRIDYNTFTQIVRTINDITDNIGLDSKQKWDKWHNISILNILIIIFMCLGAFIVTLMAIFHDGPNYIFIVTITTDALLCICLSTFACFCCKQHSIQKRRKGIQGYELQSRLKIMNEITKNKMLLSYEKPNLTFTFKANRVEIHNDLLYISSDNYGNNQRDEYNPLLPYDIDDNNYIDAEECKPMIRHEMEVTFEPTANHKYKFPKKFKDRMDENTFLQITQIFDDMFNDIAPDLRAMADKYYKYMWWGIGCIVVSTVLMLACFAIGLSHHKLFFVYWIGCGFSGLIAISVMGILWAFAKSYKYYRARARLCVNELNERLKIMNEKMKNELTFTYFKGKLIMEVKVDYLEVMSNNGIVRIIGNNFYQKNALIEFKSGTSKAIVVGNTFEGKHTIQSDNGVTVAQYANL